MSINLSQSDERRKVWRKRGATHGRPPPPTL
uniref:Uncharacterized protein n=1 Tax=Anguilla anguilla TaxID=7936 RepID=A0A0E9R7G9_ANGAN